MTVEELIQLLEGFHPDAEITIASKPSEPIAYDIEGAVETEHVPVAGEEDLEEIERAAGVVYVLAGNQLGQAPEEIWDLV